MKVIYLLSGGFLGWGLGANDSANIFGTAVYTKVVSYRLAVMLTSFFVVLGAIIDGDKGIYKVKNLALAYGVVDGKAAFIIMLSAALCVFVMTLFKLPVSTSQAVVGGILGYGFHRGLRDLSIASQFISAWVLTPIGGLVFALVLYFIVFTWFEEKLTSFVFFERFIKFGYIGAGIFGAYSLGANNVANVFGIFLIQDGFISARMATVLGGLVIAMGVITYSKPVMMTVGKGIVPLSNVSGFIVVIAAALTVYIYALIGVPVSSSQAVVGALIGVGLVKDFRTINHQVLMKVAAGWVLTPMSSGIISYILLNIFF